jgi:hypothetical protein
MNEIESLEKLRDNIRKFIRINYNINLNIIKNEIEKILNEFTE